MSGPAHAASYDPFGWLSGVRQMVLSDAPVRRGDQLTALGVLIKAQTVKPPALVLAARVTAQGHWTFVNQAGQRYTTASKQELARVYTHLAPELAVRPAPVVIYLTAASVFAHGEHLDQLPVDAKLRVVVTGQSYPLYVVGRRRAGAWFIEVRPNVYARSTDRSIFTETVWQLAKPLRSRFMRVLALRSDAPDTFRPDASIGTDGRQVVDAINPAKLTSALPTLRRQTALMTGRVTDGGTLVYRTPSGTEQSLPLAPLRATAAANDTNLLFVNAAAPRQPGTRNWLWQRVEVDGLIEALQGETLGDFLNTLSGGTGRLFVEARARDPGRVALSVVPMRAGVLEKQPGTLSSVLAELVSEVAGNVLPHAVDGDFVSMHRQQELDRRLIPGIASLIQYAVGLAFLIGLLALPVARRWWQRVWPPEVRSDYAGRGGFEAARGMRWAVFALLFLPIAGLPAALWSLLSAIAWIFRGRQRSTDTGTATG
ncbi:MAG: hypothetical protein JXQ99_23935 [Hyphomicrobiaceae bacterium]